MAITMGKRGSCGSPDKKVKKGNTETQSLPPPLAAICRYTYKEAEARLRPLGPEIQWTNKRHVIAFLALAKDKSRVRKEALLQVIEETEDYVVRAPEDTVSFVKVPVDNFPGGVVFSSLALVVTAP